MRTLFSISLQIHARGYRFNKVQQAAGLNVELKEILGQLTQTVIPVTEALPKDQAKQLAEDLSIFTNEVTKENPRPKWWNLNLDGIKEAASAVGTIGTAALQLAAKAATLL